MLQAAVIFHLGELLIQVTLRQPAVHVPPHDLKLLLVGVHVLLLRLLAYAQHHFLAALLTSKIPVPYVLGGGAQHLTVSNHAGVHFCKRRCSHVANVCVGTGQYLCAERCTLPSHRPWNVQRLQALVQKPKCFCDYLTPQGVGIDILYRLPLQAPVHRLGSQDALPVLWVGTRILHNPFLQPGQGWNVYWRVGEHVVPHHLIPLLTCQGRHETPPVP